MASIKITTNIAAVVNRIKANFELLQDREYLLRPLAQETIQNMKDRIHEKGLATDLAPIGSYSDGYMRTRAENGLGESRKVIIVLTRKLIQSWAVLPTNTGYGIGFNGFLEFQKAGWVEETYKKIIFNLSPDEKEYITKRLQQLVNGAINS